jgi:hypothetical protein
MSVINTSDELKAAILTLKNARAEKAIALKEQISVVYESIKPINLIKNTFKQVTGSTEIKNNFFNAALSMGAGYIVKMLFQTLAKSPLTKIAGSVIQFGVSSAAMNNPEIINAAEEGILQLFRNKNQKNNNGQAATTDLR